MRIGFVFLLAACGAVSDPAIRHDGPNVTHYDTASLVVRARLHAHGGVPALDIDRIYKGACDAVLLATDTVVPATDNAAAIYFLASDVASDRWRVLAPELPITYEREVIAELASTRSAIPAAEWSTDLATFRSAYGTAWSMALVPAIAAGHRIFAGVSFIGMTATEVTKVLGTPDDVGGERWQYARHTGESGLLRTINFELGRVVAVDITRTQ